VELNLQFSQTCHDKFGKAENSIKPSVFLLTFLFDNSQYVSIQSEVLRVMMKVLLLACLASFAGVTMSSEASSKSVVVEYWYT
jgi:hypothetical protein